MAGESDGHSHGTLSGYINVVWLLTDSVDNVDGTGMSGQRQLMLTTAAYGRVVSAYRWVITPLASPTGRADIVHALACQCADVNTVGKVGRASLWRRPNMLELSGACSSVAIRSSCSNIRGIGRLPVFLHCVTARSPGKCVTVARVLAHLAAKGASESVVAQQQPEDAKKKVKPWHSSWTRSSRSDMTSTHKISLSVTRWSFVVGKWPHIGA